MCVKYAPNCINLLLLHKNSKMRASSNSNSIINAKQKNTSENCLIVAWKIFSKTILALTNANIIHIIDVQYQIILVIATGLLCFKSHLLFGCICYMPSKKQCIYFEQNTQDIKNYVSLERLKTKRIHLLNTCKRAPQENFNKKERHRVHYTVAAHDCLSAPSLT